MLKKCKICGYRFKDKSEIICPECFTSRESDFTCNDFSDDLHSHKIDSESQDRFSRKKINSEEKSFIDTQRENEESSSAMKSTYSAENTIDKPNFDYSVYNKQNQSSNNKYNNSQNNYSDNHGNYNNNFDNTNNNQTTDVDINKMLNYHSDNQTYMGKSRNGGKGTKGCLFLILFLIVIGPILFSIINIAIARIDFKHNSDAYDNKKPTYDADFYDDEYYSYDNDQYKLSLANVDLHQISSSEYSDIFDENEYLINIYNDDITYGNFYYIKTDILLDKLDDDFNGKLSMASLSAYSDDGELLFDCTLLDCIYVSDYDISECKFLIPECDNFTIHADIEIENGDSYGFAQINVPFEDIEKW